MQQYGEVFVQAIQNDMASVRQTAMKALFDIIMVWGTKVVSQCSTDPLAFLATNLGPTTQDALRRIAVEGFVKLLVSDTVRDEKVHRFFFFAYRITSYLLRFLLNYLCSTLRCATTVRRS